jgi:hypothetical protein
VSGREVNALAVQALLSVGTILWIVPTHSSIFVAISYIIMPLMMEVIHDSFVSRAVNHTNKRLSS